MQFSVGGDTVTVREGGTSRGFRKEAHKILERERAKKNQEADSPQAVVIDVDVYHEDPPSIDVKDFMITHTSNLLELLRGTITQSQQVNQ